MSLSIITGGIRLNLRKVFAWFLFFLLFCFIPNGLFVNDPVSAVQWDVDWSYLRECSIDSSKIGATLGNFPVLVVVPTEVGVLADGGDSLRFVDSDLNSLNYEIELWNSSGDSFVWVNVTSVSSISDTVFYMFYNNTVASDDQNPTGVWDVNYTMVLHMNGTAYDDIIDSTSNKNNVVSQTGSPRFEQDGQIGYCVYLNRASSESLTGSTTFGMDDNCTVEVVAKQLVSSAGQWIFDTGGSRGNANGLGVQVDTSRMGFSIHDAEFDKRFDKWQTLTPTNWVYGGASASDSTGFYRTNGVSGALVLSTGVAVGDSLQNFVIGSGYNNVAYFDGFIDEIRISNISRNASWLKASYYSCMDDLITIGSQLQQGNITVNTSVPVSGSTDVTPGNLTHSVNVYEFLGLTMNITWRWSSDGVTWYSFGSNSTINNGTYSMVNTDNYTSYNHTYYWNVTVDNGYETQGTLFIFRTKSNEVGNPIGISSNYLNTELGFNWTLGYRNDRVILVSSNGSGVSSPDDAIAVAVYNGTGTSCIDTGITSNHRYYTIFGYNTTDELYSSGLNVPWGGMSINVFDEDTLAPLIFDIFVTNQQGTQTYYAEYMSNTLYISLDDLPQGSNVAVHISANTSYNIMSEYFSGYQRDGLNRQNSTTTYIQLAKIPLNKTSTTVTCINTSGNSKSTPGFILVDNIITIYPDAANEFNSVYVNYSYTQYRSRTYYFDTIMTNVFYTLDAYLASTEITNLYLLSVVGVQGEFSSPPLSDVSISIRRYLGGTFQNVSILLTDANGQVEAYLIPNILYKCVLVKDGYETTYVDYIPSGSVFTHTFRMNPTSAVTPPTDYDSFWDNIVFTAVMDNPGYLLGSNITISYYDTNSSTTNTMLYLYDSYSHTLVGSIGYSLNSLSYIFNGINYTRSYYAILYFNNTANFDISSPVIITIFNQWIYGSKTSPASLEDRITSIVGPFSTDTFSTDWVNIISISLAFILLVSFGVFNVGFGVIAGGLGLGFSNVLIGMHFSDVISPLLVGTATVIVFIGIMLMWSKSRGGENL